MDSVEREFVYGTHHESHSKIRRNTDRASPFASSPKANALKEFWLEHPAQAFEEWMDAGQGGKGFKERSKVVYGAMWKKLIKYALPLGLCPAFMTAQQIRGFLHEVLARGSAVPSPTQQRRYLSLLASVQGELVGLGCLNSNAARELINEKPMQEVTFLRNLPVALQPGQELAIKAWLSRRACPVHPSQWRVQRDSALVCMVLGSGVKLHELQSLRLSDVIMKNPDSDAPAVVRITTNGAKERRSPLTPQFEQPVLDWMIWLREQGAPHTLPMFLSSEDEQAGAIDPELELDLNASLPLARIGHGEHNVHEGVKAMSSAQIWRVVHQAFIECGFNERLARHGPTVLRNTFAMRQLRAGVPIDTVSLWLGHKDRRSTEVYRALLGEPGAFSVM